MKKPLLFITAMLLQLGLSGLFYAPAFASPNTTEKHLASANYVYRSENFITPEKAEKKTFWDYFSFFAFPKEEKKLVPTPAAEAKSLKKHIHDLGDQLLKNATEGIADEYVITVSSFVNLNNLYQVSSFGRYIGEQLIGELQLAGVEIIDVRKTPGMMIREGKGEYALSREMEELSYIHASQATIVGTYTYANGQILLNARLLYNQNGMVLSQANIVFDLDPLTEKLLADDGMPRRKDSVVSVKAFN